MAVSGSGLYVATVVDVFDTTQLAIDLDLETHKGALFQNSITPNFTTDTAYGVSPYNAGEVAGTNYTAGGKVLTGTTFTGSAGIATFDAADLQWAASTITNARCLLVYADALTNNNAIVLLDFGGDYSTSNGDLDVVFNAAGLFYLDLVP